VAGSFLLPADRVFADENDDNGLATEVTKEQIENSPRYDNNVVLSGDGWRNYEQEFKKYWEEHPVMHMKGSDRIITPPEEPAPDEARSTREGNRESELSVDPAKLFPERISDVFSDPALGAGKVTLRPKPVAGVEEAASGVSMLKPHWWEAFENYLHLNNSDIQAKCSQCSSKAAEPRRHSYKATEKTASAANFHRGIFG
jgi:hypothetical protein